MLATTKLSEAKDRKYSVDLFVNLDHADDEFGEPTGVKIHLTTFTDKGRIFHDLRLSLTFEESLHLAHRLLSLIGESGNTTAKPAKGS